MSAPHAARRADDDARGIARDDEHARLFDDAALAAALALALAQPPAR